MESSKTRPTETQFDKNLQELRYERWQHWPVNWSSACVGALSATAALIVFGLIGIAIGVYVVNGDQRLYDWREFGLWTGIFSVFGSFLAFVIGGWIAGKIGGFLRSEPAMLHGAIAWLLSVPLILLIGTAGAGSFMGSWYSGLTDASGWTSNRSGLSQPLALAPNASEGEIVQHRAEVAEYARREKLWQTQAPIVAKNTALGAVTALLLGLMGGVIGGWMASGEPMTIGHYKTRNLNLKIAAAGR